MSWFSRIFGNLFGGGQTQERLAAYVIREHGLGRTLDDILDDPYLRNRASENEIRALLERPEVVRAVGHGARD